MSSLETSPLPDSNSHLPVWDPVSLLTVLGPFSYPWLWTQMYLGKANKANLSADGSRWFGHCISTNAVCRGLGSISRHLTLRFVALCGNMWRACRHTVLEPDWTKPERGQNKVGRRTEPDVWWLSWFYPSDSQAPYKVRLNKCHICCRDVSVLCWDLAAASSPFATYKLLQMEIIWFPEWTKIAAEMMFDIVFRK